MKLDIASLSYRYKNSKDDTLNGVSFSLEEGRVTTLLGPNGSGKTTLVKCLLGKLKGEGEIRLDGEDFRALSFKQRHAFIGYLPQEQPPASSLSVFEMVLLGGAASLGLRPREEDLKRASRLLEQFGLAHLGKKRYGELSGGERRLVNIAQVLFKEPKILILDEPTANLDIANELEVLNLIRQYVSKKRVLCLLVLHSINMASKYSDDICLFKDGEIFRCGSPQEVITAAAIKQVYHVVVEQRQSQEGYPLIHLQRGEQEKEYDFQ